MSEERIPADQLVAAYIETRNAMAVQEEEYEASRLLLKTKLDDLSAALLAICNEQNVDGLKTAAGTVTRSVTSRYWTSDWGSMYEFITAHEAPFLLEQRIHNSNMKQFLADHPEAMPMGLQANSSYVIRVRKPAATR